MTAQSLQTAYDPIQATAGMSLADAFRELGDAFTIFGDGYCGACGGGRPNDGYGNLGPMEHLRGCPVERILAALEKAHA